MSEEIKDLIIEMSEGNPGAINVMMQMQVFKESWKPMLETLNANAYTGSKIWMLYKDECKEDLAIMGIRIVGMMTSETMADLIKKKTGEGSNYGYQE